MAKMIESSMAVPLMSNDINISLAIISLDGLITACPFVDVCI